MSSTKTIDRRYNLFQIFQQIHKQKFQIPKRIINQEPCPALERQKSRLKHIRNLAEPKLRNEYKRRDWSLTPALKFYKPTQRIEELSKPILRGNGSLYQPLPTRVPLRALNYKPSVRILELAAVPEKSLGNTDLRKNPYVVPLRALRARPSRRINELAQPKEYAKQIKKRRRNPFTVPKSALRAKPSFRILNLAKPRTSWNKSSEDSLSINFETL